ncbi:MAG: DUF4040 domain-containing protein [Acidobacteriota bacterium]
MTADLLVDLLLLLVIVATAVAALTTKSLLAASMMLGLYSLAMAAAWVALDAPDVAFTEAAVGAGVSTVFLLSALARIGWEEKSNRGTRWLPTALTLALGLTLAYSAGDLPEFGASDTPIHQGVSKQFLERTIEDTHVPNVVSSVLASYRGFDTLFETTVIFTAGACVVLLLRPRRRPADETAS